MQEFLELNPWVAYIGYAIAGLVIVAGLILAALLFVGGWVVAVLRLKGFVVAAAGVIAIPGKTGKARAFLGLVLATVISKISSRAGGLSRKLGGIRRGK